MTFKPLLAFSKMPDLNKLRYPVLVSPKLDGIRASKQEGRMLSRTLKPIPNVNVQSIFRLLPEGIDGELIDGNPTDPGVFQRTTSIVMSENKPAYNIRLFVFDKYSETAGFKERLSQACDDIDGFLHTQLVQHIQVENEDELLQAEQLFLTQGYEGAMIRKIDGRYKQGRSTENEGILLKLKRFVDAEAEIVGFEEEMQNTNTATVSELGRTKRSSAQAGMVPKGTLGAFIVRGAGGSWHGVEFNIGTGLTAEQKRDFWKNREKLLGSLLKFKYQEVGSKDAPRIPVFLGFRDRRDI